LHIVDLLGLGSLQTKSRHSAATRTSILKSRNGSQGMTMSKNLYVGNLSFNVTADSLREAFEQFGTVKSAAIVSDRETGRSRGFGFVEMENGGDDAIAGLNGKEFEGRTLTVNEARPRTERRGGGGGGGGSGGRRGGRY
jgi:RNA recognition motif-containing protein